MWEAQGLWPSVWGPAVVGKAGRENVNFGCAEAERGERRRSRIMKVLKCFVDRFLLIPKVL